MGQGGAKSKLGGVKSKRPNAPGPNTLRPCPQNARAMVLYLNPILSVLCLKSKTYNIKVITHHHPILII